MNEKHINDFGVDFLNQLHDDLLTVWGSEGLTENQKDAIRKAATVIRIIASKNGMG